MSNQILIPFETEVKKCSVCKIQKSATEFYRRKSGREKGRLRCECKKCGHKIHKEYDKRRPRESKRDEQLRTKFGITLEQYEDLLLKQEFKCAICGKVADVNVTRDKMKWQRSLSVDHCHSTGKIRGLLCWHCNTGIGKLGDTVDGLMRAVRYLQKSLGDDNDAA